MFNPSQRKNKTKYYVDFYDTFDGWGIFGFYQKRLFDDLENAIKCCRKLQDKLSSSNKKCGQHYGVIDGELKREVFCGKGWDGIRIDKKKLQKIITYIQKRNKVRRNAIHKKE